MKKKRCFTAVNFDSQLKIKIFNWSKKNYKKFENVKWVAQDNFHITLHFLGYLTNKEIKKVGEVLKNINNLNIKNIKANINGIDCFPHPGQAKILFLKIKQGSKELEKIQNNIAQKLNKKVNYKLEKRKWIPHVTVARFKNSKNISINSFKEIKHSFLVNSIDLMESTLSRKGPTYSILKKYYFNN